MGSNNTGSNISTGELVVSLLIFGLLSLVVVAAMVVGAIGFHHRGRGDPASLPARAAWLIGLLDVGMLAGITQTPLVGVPLILHATMFCVGRLRGPLSPSPPPG